MRRARDVLFGTACGVAPSGRAAWHRSEGYIGKDENARVSVTPQRAWRP
jgi:hypothetical protein